MIDIQFGHGSITDRDDYLRRAVGKYQNKTSDLHDICILAGDPELLIELTNRSPSIVSHYNILLSLHKSPKEFPISQSLELLHLFKKYFLTDLGFERHEVYVAAVEHRDKDNIHIHATIPNISLITGKPLNFFFPRRDQYWKNNIAELLELHFFTPTQYEKLKLVSHYRQESIKTFSTKMRIRETIRALIASTISHRIDVTLAQGIAPEKITNATIISFINAIPYLSLHPTKSRTSVSVQISPDRLPDYLKTLFSHDRIALTKATERPMALQGQALHVDFNLQTYRNKLDIHRSNTPEHCQKKHEETCAIIKPLRGPSHNNAVSRYYMEVIGNDSGILSYMRTNNLKNSLRIILQKTKEKGYAANSESWDLPNDIYSFTAYNSEDNYSKKKKNHIRTFLEELRAWIFNMTDPKYEIPDHKKRPRKKHNTKTKTPCSPEPIKDNPVLKNKSLFDFERD